MKRYLSKTASPKTTHTPRKKEKNKLWSNMWLKTAQQRDLSSWKRMFWIIPKRNQWMRRGDEERKNKRWVNLCNQIFKRHFSEREKDLFWAVVPPQGRFYFSGYEPWGGENIIPSALTAIFVKLRQLGWRKLTWEKSESWVH